MTHATAEELEAGLAEICRSPRNDGTLELIVRRPNIGHREVVHEAALDVAIGLVGDSWKNRGSALTPDGSPHPGMQLNLMNSRVIALLTRDRERWPLAGDQLFVDLDLSADNLPPGTQLAIGSAVIEVTAHPHIGCRKFVARFGVDAAAFVNSPRGRQLRLRGINARVTQAGIIRAGDAVKKYTDALMA
jgi:hypothetical protein